MLFIDFSNWEWFKIGDIFKLEKGKCSNAPDLEEGNDIPYIGAKKNENGFMGFFKYDKKLVSKENCICFISQGAGSNGFCNYFDIETIQSTSNVLGYNKNLTPNIGLFIVTVSDLERPKWCFGRGRAPKLKNEMIKLPSKNGEPDWEFMENYIKILREREREPSIWFIFKNKKEFSINFIKTSKMKMILY
ncbi:MAG: restriction endonuclease subunit S [Ureaplasma sp.]|nr:restriction endonuclease subunit S [Ureaplasma sp.]